MDARVNAWMDGWMGLYVDDVVGCWVRGKVLGIGVASGLWDDILDG